MTSQAGLIRIRDFNRFGVHGPSQVVDSNAYDWKDHDWLGIKKRDLIVYELHVGSFTEEGTYTAAIDRLDELVELWCDID